MAEHIKEIDERIEDYDLKNNLNFYTSIIEENTFLIQFFTQQIKTIQDENK
jgi:hypothetical protein